MQTISNQRLQFKQRADAQDVWERVVFAEVLVPNVTNPMGDYWTPEAIKEAAYMFMKVGFGIDLEHDNIDISDRVAVVESFIVREGDPDFIKDSWVIAMHVDDDTLWQGVLDGDITGFSYEAFIATIPATLETDDDGVRTGFTEPDLVDGHRHAYTVILGDDGRPSAGGTDTVDGHSHVIKRSTVTEVAKEHKHRYNMVKAA